MRWQQRERRARAHAQALYASGVAHAVAVYVGGERGALAYAQVAQLRLLEVRVHPHAGERHHGHERRARGDALAELHAAPRDEPVHRRGQRGAVRRKPRGAQLRGSGLHAWVLGDGHALRERLVAGKLLARRDHARARRRLARARRRKLRARRRQRALRVLELLGRDRALRTQLHAPLHVLLGALQVALRGGLRRDRLGDVGLAQFHLCGERGVVGVELAHLAHRLRQACLGLAQRHLRVRRIELHERRARVHEVVVVGEDGHHRAAHLRRDLDHVALHVGVVGAFLVARDEHIVRAPRGQADERDERQHDEALAPPGLGDGEGCGGIG